MVMDILIIKLLKPRVIASLAKIFIECAIGLLGVHLKSFNVALNSFLEQLYRTR